MCGRGQGGGVCVGESVNEVCMAVTGCRDGCVPRGFTLHMTGYAPACTKSVEKGSFLDIRRRRRLLQKGYIFRC